MPTLVLVRVGVLLAQRIPNASTGEYRNKAAYFRIRLQLGQLMLIQFSHMGKLGASFPRESFYDGSVWGRYGTFTIASLHIQIPFCDRQVIPLHG